MSPEGPMTARPHLDGREIEAVLIDAGGVLVEPNWDTVASVLGEHALEVDPADLAAANPLLMRELDDAELIKGSTDVMRRERWLARLLRHAGRTADIDEGALDAAADEIERIQVEQGIWETILDGVPDALDALRDAGLRLSLVSNAEPLLRRKLGELDLARRFDHLAISGEVGVEKPDPRIFLGALEALGASPEHAVHVGDLYEVDVVGARGVGAAAVLVDGSDLSGDRDVTRIRSLAELPRLLGLGERP
jgi:HAD superfamily hydrolase (TIGR01549 family)